MNSGAAYIEMKKNQSINMLERFYKENVTSATVS